jgi:dTDP-4-dehydrorhamnose reductase
MWAGVECTVNRVGDRYSDQLVRSGHDARACDLDRLASLGVQTVRYPILWERTVERGWAWADERLARLPELGIRAIAGLLHHGSGPRTTSLVDPRLPELLAAYAREVAERYPWLDSFTPVNEPLTTARFSGLYGHWHPHGRDDRTFLTALVVLCKATVLAMRAIREVTPSARFISTEDLGFTRSTPHLAYQAAFDNERRWLSSDLLCGRIDRAHPLWPWLVRHVGERDLMWFAEHPCPPDLLGLNYYLTSERWLDDDLEAWPVWSHGSNGRDAYADVHAVLAGHHLGPRPHVEAALQRYGIPIVITEAHLGGTREEQLRWLVEIWDAAATADVLPEDGARPGLLARHAARAAGSRGTARQLGRPARCRAVVEHRARGRGAARAVRRVRARHRRPRPRAARPARGERARRRAGRRDGPDRREPRQAGHGAVRRHAHARVPATSRCHPRTSS